MNKRERVLTTLQLQEPDLIPIHCLGFEPTGTAYQNYVNSEEIEQAMTIIPSIGDITEQRFWNQDCHAMSPFPAFSNYKIPPPPEYADCRIDHAGRIKKTIRTEKTHQLYDFYVTGYFRTKEIIHDYWGKYGRPVDHLNPSIKTDKGIWDQYVGALAPYLYPIPRLAMSIHESLFEGMTLGRLAYYLRKDPAFIHEVCNEYCKPNIAMIKRLAEAGVDVVFFYDDLGQRDRSILSLTAFREFILPYYKKIYQECKRHSMYIIQHSCGYIDEFLPDMVDAGLSCIQALEPAAGVNLAQLKEILGDRVAFMGGMDSSRILNFGTPADVAADVKKCIKAAANGGGYFAGPSHNILDVPWANIQALRAALEKYRKYPLL